MVRVVACHARDRGSNPVGSYVFFPLGLLHLFSCPQDVKEAAYKSMVRPILEYGSTVWDPHCNGLNDDLEKRGKACS